MDRIIKNSWTSKYDIHGSVFDNSTNFSIITMFFNESLNDVESTHRFY